MTLPPLGFGWQHGEMAGPITEFALPYDLDRVAATAERRRRRFRGRVISLVITIAVVVGFALWLRSQGQAAALWVSGVVVAVSLAWVVVSYVIYRRARADLRGLQPGTAVRLGPVGAEVAGLGARWNDVGSLTMVRGGVGRSPRLRLNLVDGRSSSVPLDQVSVMPATLDSTARAYSAGRHGVDLTALDA